ncbi:hypothetical protein DXN05_17515 [Deminuibacter soli]|uniref:Uncharacterized protein n=2 Tax=Deminuibacter soli TaxID=2291815 RepID=A0A3E1NFP7_9BACT|nr:hypothetical protein DXN05_17515 [Deminuibacter soli]
MIDGNKTTVKATAFKTPSNDARFRVSINESPIHIFSFDEKLQRFTDIEAGAKAEPIPATIEKAVGEQLYHLQQSIAA